MWGTGKDRRELKDFNGVKGQLGQEKGKCNKRQSRCVFTKRKANVQVADLTSHIPYLPDNMTGYPSDSHTGRQLGGAE